MIEVALEDIQVRVFGNDPTGINTLDMEVWSYRYALINMLASIAQ